MECIVCDQTIDREEAIWSCPDCYSVYHLKCVASWAQTCIQKRIIEAIKNKQSASSVSREWSCKYCQKEFTTVPNRYLCFCGKTENPEFDPWLPPHSCGNLCGRALPCGHICNERCHPGRCPPCPRVIAVSCPCGKTKQTVRCSMQHIESPDLLCKLPCLKLLSCGKHKCRQKCHYGPCPPCSLTVHQTCFCGSESRDIPCSQDTTEHYSCGRICNKPLSCGHHFCTLPCHEGTCPPCPNQPPRTCFCGKKTFDLPCTAETPSCHQTCDHVLPCGHHCPLQCHPPPCPPCEIPVLKRCRCGQRQKECKCSEEFLCQSRCDHLRSCGNHRCGRRCCDGQHFPCTQVCGKPLDCGRHNCQLPCHSGPCPTCALAVTVTCECGKTTVEVPCKEYRKAFYPPCQHLCEKPSHCHHSKIQPHFCHPGKCPECLLPCGLLLPCGHFCSAICHEGKPCPPCKEMVPKKCVGNHKLVEVTCAEKEKPVTCDEKCGKLLACGKHVCSLPCHDASIPCETCYRPCQGRSTCHHPCSFVFCHAGECEPCTQLVKRPCFCGKTSKSFQCWEVSGMTSKTGFFCCGKVCGKPLKGCRHGCRLICHEGPCGECKVEIAVKCPCGKRVEAMQCCEAQKKEGYDASSPVQVMLECNEECGVKRVEREKEEKGKEEQVVQSRGYWIGIWIGVSVLIALIAIVLGWFYRS